MFTTIIPLVSWSNGIMMIGVFAAVVLILISALYFLMQSGKSSNKS